MEGLENPSVLTEAFESMAVLIFVAAGFLMVFRATRMAKRFVVIGVLAVLLAATHETLSEEIAVPVLAAITVLVALGLLRLILRLFIGRRASGVAVGNLVSYLLSLVLLLLLFPAKKLWQLFQSN